MAGLRVQQLADELSKGWRRELQDEAKVMGKQRGWACRWRKRVELAGPGAAAEQAKLAALGDGYRSVLGLALRRGDLTVAQHRGALRRMEVQRQRRKLEIRGTCGCRMLKTAKKCTRQRGGSSRGPWGCIWLVVAGEIRSSGGLARILAARVSMRRGARSTRRRWPLGVSLRACGTAFRGRGLTGGRPPSESTSAAGGGRWWSRRAFGCAGSVPVLSWRRKRRVFSAFSRVRFNTFLWARAGAAGAARGCRPT